jgi:hypothetical protein
MKTAIVLVLGSALFQSVVGLVLPAQGTSAGLVARDASIQTDANSPDFNLDLYARSAAGGSNAQPKTEMKHCKKGKGKIRRGSGSDGEGCPPLPTKAQIKANLMSNPSFHNRAPNESNRIELL